MSSYIYILFQITKIICSFSLTSSTGSDKPIKKKKTCVYMQKTYVFYFFIFYLIKKLFLLFLFFCLLKCFVQMISD